MKKKVLSLFLAVGLCLGLAACGSSAGTSAGSGSDASKSASAASTSSSAASASKSESEGASSAVSGTASTASGLPSLTRDTIKIGFIYGSSIGTEGYTYSHDLGRLALEAEGIQTMYIENVPETEECEKAAEDLIAQGCNVIYAISFGHGDYIANVADKHPEVYFNHATGYINKANMSTYAGRYYEAQYLAGIAAAMKTESNQIGYVTTFPIPEVVRQVNSFTLGARSVNPDVTVSVKWTSSWYDPATEKAAATELINSGCDIISAYCDTLNPQMTAQENNCFAIGCSSPGYETIPKAYLTAPMVDWAAYYTMDVASILDGTWTGENRWLGMADGIVVLDTLSENCAEGTEEAVDTAKKAIIDGSLDVWAGEIKDNEGNVKVAEGKTLSDEELLALDWFVEGVIGSVN